MTLRLVSILLMLLISVNSGIAAVLTVQMSAEPTQFDPLQMEDGSALKIAANTVGTLFAYDGKGDRWKSLIDNYTVSRDRRLYTFHFKKDLKWSDGKPFHADHFILALKRLENEPVKVSLSDLFPKLNLKKTRATGPRTAEVSLTEPDLQFPNWLTLPPYAPIRQDMIDTYVGKRTPVVPTLGAYEVVEYKREEYLNLKKNSYFVEQDQVKVDEVKIRFVGDEGTLLPLLKSGTVDILSKVPVLQLKPIADIAQVHEVPVEAVTYLAFDTRKPPFNEKQNRQLFQNVFSVGKRLELARLLKTGEQAAITFLPQVLMPPGFRRDAQVAAIKSDKQLEFLIQSDSGSRNQTILEFAQSILKVEVKWKVGLDLLDWKTHYSKLKTGPDAVYRFGWQNPVSEPFIVYETLSSKSPNNFTGWSNLNYDALTEKLRQENRMVKKLKLISQLEDILYEEAPVIPLLSQVLRFACSKRVLGFRANSFGVILFRELRLSESNAIASPQ